MIAGVKIRYLDGTLVEPGGNMHGYITTTNEYCGSLPPAMVAVTTGVNEFPESAPGTRFMIFPNPTTGKFTLVQKEGFSAEKVEVVIFGMHGEKLLSTVYPGTKEHEFVLQNLPVGLYFVRIVSGGYVETIKLIRTD